MDRECAVPSITDRHAAYFAQWPCSMAATATQGRHLIAVRDFACGETVLVSEAYVKALLPSHKKRICAGCMHDGGRRLAVHCSGCGEAWYCSDACRQADASGAAHQGAPTGNLSVPRIPHSMLCPVLAHFGGLKADADMECILRMCVDLAGLQRLAAPGTTAACASDECTQAVPHESSADDPSPKAVQFEAQAPGRGTNSVSNCSTVERETGHDVRNGGSPPLPALTFSDFQLLQCHPVALSERDAQLWRRGLSLLQAALQRADWPQPPSQDDMLQWAGRVAANSFSRFSDCGRSSNAAPGGSDQPVKSQQQAERSHADGSAASSPAATPLQRQQQQQQSAAQSAQSQLQRLQLAQRCLWEGSSDSSQQHGSAPAIAPASGLSDSAKTFTSVSDAHAAPSSSTHRQASEGIAEQPAAQRTDEHGGPLPADQPQPTSLINDDTCTPRLATNSAGSASAHPCGIASAGASAVANAQPIGRETFITASYFNHSLLTSRCQPNCIIHRRGSLGVVTAQSDIKAGDELCISYIDLDVPRSTRQALLHRMFHFTCKCERCQQELVEGSAKCSYASNGSSGSKACCAPKRRGRKARVSR